MIKFSFYLVFITSFMKISNISILSYAQQVTLLAYDGLKSKSIILSEIISRLAAVVLLSLAAACDLVIHTVALLPVCIYSIGKSIYLGKADFTLLWQVLQRVRNSVAPILLGSLFGLFHPFAGLAMCEPSDKQAVMGMLASNVDRSLETPCSPIHSISIVESIASNNKFATVNGVKKEIFSTEHIQALKDCKRYERSLESLQAQEFIHKITNLTLAVMAKILRAIDDSSLSETTKKVFARLSGLLIPILTLIDVAIAILLQGFFLITGVVRALTGRGPIYTEITVNPLMHLAFLFQNILKAIGNLIGTLVWFVSPLTGFKVSLYPSNSFFKLQVDLLMGSIKRSMNSPKAPFLVIPIVYGNGDCSVFSIPSHSMHKTYLIVSKKQDKQFDLCWVNRPNLSIKKGLTSEETLKQIRSMINERFPFMDIEKIFNYPVKSNTPKFETAITTSTLANQGGSTNCVVSNLFGMLEAIDQIKGTDKETTALRYKVVRQALLKDYSFYEHNFSPFASSGDGYSLSSVWEKIQQNLEKPI